MSGDDFDPEDEALTITMARVMMFVLASLFAVSGFALRGVLGLLDIGGALLIVASVALEIRQHEDGDDL